MAKKGRGESDEDRYWGGVKGARKGDAARSDKMDARDSTAMGKSSHPNRRKEKSSASQGRGKNGQGKGTFH